MKKFFVLLCCVAVAASCFVLTSCGGSSDLSNSKYLGTWVAETIDAFGDVENAEDVNEAIEGGMSMVLNADGTAIMNLGTDDPVTVNWSETSNGIKTSGDVKLTFKEEDGGLKTDIVGANIHFVKQ